ncbi:GTP pyrophosphokinase [Nocardia sp. CA-107356]|uniref:GTP pyrophosphokinase n=1 Tax=Nocardia sp. CA-107356 TaxID=3239972 RepID=UPI003D8DDC16
MDVIADFVSRYTKEIDFYENVARRARDLLEAELKKEGVRGAVSHRAKSIDRLEEKCRQRDAKREESYVSVEEIYDDIVDLAGARIALYFPSDREIVASTIVRIFDLIEDPKGFPDPTKTRPGNPRFAGYTAQHFRVRFKEPALTASEKRYASAKIEIQVASVFMHGWSEVEHDLVYKPRDGDLSDEEYALLDQLNGLAISAEIALETLQKAIERRIAERNRKFGDHYELATHLLGKLGISDKVSVNNAGLGRMDYLFDLTSRLGLNSPIKIDAYIDTLHDNFERRPLADQVTDALLAEDDSRYRLYLEIQNMHKLNLKSPNETLGAFLVSWIKIEQLELNIWADIEPENRRPQPFGRRLYNSNIVNPEIRNELRSIRNIRNRIVHGQESEYTLADLDGATNRLNEIYSQIVQAATAQGLLKGWEPRLDGPVRPPSS